MLRPLGLQDRIFAWYGGTVLGVLGLVLVLVHIRVDRETNKQLTIQMRTAGRVVESLQQERIATLAMVASLAGTEPILGAAVAGVSGTKKPVDPRTLEDILHAGLQSALGSDFVRITDVHGRVLVDTSGRVRPYTDLSNDPDVRAALHGGVPHGDVPHGMLILPGAIDLVATSLIYVGGQHLGTVTVGRRVSDEVARQFFEYTGNEVTYFAGGKLAASSWPAPARQDLLCAVQMAPPGTAGRDGTRSFFMTLGGRRFMCLLIPVYGENGARGMLLIQGDLDAALQPYNNTQRVLGGIGLLGLIAAILGSVIVARGITQPLQRIARAAQGLMQGDWSQRTPVTSRDEVGLLAETFNRMAERLESWDSDMRAAVEERTQDLNAVVGQLHAAYQQMRQFNADASHELRTPLTVIRGEAEVALRTHRSGPEYQAVLRTIQEETEHMSRIIEQLLLLARADSGELRLERRPVALDDLVRDVCHRAEVLARARRIRLRTGELEPVLLDGDEDQLRRLALNLVDNAIKYTPEGGEVNVRLHSETTPTDERPPQAVLEVADTGIGINAAHLSQIFDRFYRVDKARSRSQGGSGLGLAICQWIVEAHGGRIEVHSQPDMGSTFTVRLPGAAIPLPDDSSPELAEIRD
jgi:signal transduction histidine kinase